MSSATPTSRSRPRSSGSSPTRSTPAGCCPARGSPPVRELGCRPASEPQHDPGGLPASGRRAATSRVATAPGTHVADRPPQQRGAEALAGHRRRDAPARRRGGLHGRRGRVGGLRRGRRAEAARRAGPGPVRGVHERRRRLRRRAPEPGLRRPDPGRGDAARRPARSGSTGSTTTSSRRRRSTPTRRRRSSTAGFPVVAMLVGPGYVELVHEIAGLPVGLAGRARLRLRARHREHGRDAGAVGHDRASSC